MTSGDGKTEPYTAKVTARSSYLYDGSGTDCPSYPCANGELRSQQFDYDVYGNRIQVLDHGNYAASGDETTTVVEYNPNPVDYIVNRPARTISYFGLGVSGVVLSDARTYYDGALSHTDSPSLGFITKSDVWLNTESRYIAQCPQSECILYDANGNVTKTIDTKGGETTLVYDTTYQKFVTSVTNAELHVTQTPDWDLLCEAPERAIDPNLQESTTSYDTLCRHERSDGPAGTGVYSESLYASLGNPNAQNTETRSPSPDGTGFYWTRTYFDGLGRSYKTESKSGEPGKTVVSGEATFNARGLITEAAQPRFDGDPQYNTTFTYDPRNRVTEKKYADCNPSCSTETFMYGLNYSVHTNPEGEYSVTSRDATGLTTYFVEYLGGNPIYTTTIHVPQNRVTAVYDNRANQWITQTDSLGRPTATLDPDSGWEVREYYDSGELEATVNALGERTELTYDGLGRMLTRTTRAGTANAQVTTFTYDGFDALYSNIGTLSRMDDSEGFEVYDYDALGRPKRKRRNLDSQDYTFVFSYNAAGLPSSTLYPDTQTISWTYDAAGNLETETGTITASSYDAAGRLKTREFTNEIVTTMSYDPARGWVDSINAAEDGEPAVQDLTYQYNRDGTIQSVTSQNANETWTYEYDDLNRLLSATNANPSLTQTFEYDAIGNITENSHIGTYTYPAATNPQPHAVATAGGHTYAYNTIGQMTSRNGTIIQWNGDGKPSSIGNVVFAYDGVGGRLKKTSGGQTTKWIGGDYEIAHSGTVTKYLTGGKQVGTDFFVHHRDHLGSIQAVTDANAVDVRRQAHRAFGDQHFVSGSHLESKGWIGEREEETELVYLNARYYDPEIGRFISPDPIVLKGQLANRYSYAANNPVVFSDPTGLLLNCGIDAGCGGGGGPEAFLFDFTHCRPGAFARGECDPGLQVPLIDTRRDPLAEQFREEAEARHDAIVDAAFARTDRYFGQERTTQDGPPNGDYYVDLLSLAGEDVYVFLHEEVMMGGLTDDFWFDVIEGAFGRIDANRGLNDTDRMVLSYLNQLWIVPGDRTFSSNGELVVAGARQLGMRNLNGSLPAAIAHEAAHQFQFASGRWNPDRGGVGEYNMQMGAYIYQHQFSERYGMSQGYLDRLWGFISTYPNVPEEYR